MQRTVYILLCSLLLGGAWLSPAKGASFTFTTIDVPGALETLAYGINDAGQIVGKSLGQGFLKDGANFITFNVPGAGTTQAYGINNAGQVVGVFHDGSTYHGFLTTPCGRPNFQGTYPTSHNPQLISSNGWSMTTAVTDRDGLEVRDVMLGGRYMAARMNIPYFRLETSNFPISRCELKPNSADLSCQSRL